MHSELRPPTAAIFDMDGVLVDSNPFHIRKWAALLTAHHIPFDPDELGRIVLGPPNALTLRRFFGDALSAEQIKQLDEQFEEKFREVFRPHAKPMPGLVRLLTELQQAGIPMAVASAAMRKNVEFIIEALDLRPYFRCLIPLEEVTRGKPHPEIYLKAAARLGAEATHCVAFEDSFVGIEAVKRAGMKCVAVASTFPAAELRQKTSADLIIPNFTGIDLETLRRLFSADLSE
jgi:HAD superfamily hydrolase (TIGR01509 family)